MSDHRSPEEIEKQLERDREGLSDTLTDLRERFSLDAIFRQATDQFREHGGDIGASVSRAVKDNPLALTLTGVGLAWLILGDKQGQGTAPRLERSYDPDPYRGQARASGSGYVSAGPATYDSRPATTPGVSPSANLPDWARDHDHDTLHESGASAAERQSPSTSDGPSLSDRARAGAGAVRGAASNASHSVREGAQNTARGTRDRATAMRERISHGTEHLTAEGRARVIAARERAHDARQRGMVQLRRGQDRAVDLYEEQPLIAGALALAIGAAIGASLPRTKFEDDTFGERSDELIHEAERIFAEERAKVGAVAEAALHEARDIADEAGASVEGAARQAKSDADRNASGQTAAQDVADMTKEKGSEAANRIGEAARAEAERQDLGKSRT